MVDEFMDEEILEALNDNPFHHQEEMVASLLDENQTQQDFNYDSHVSSSKFDDNLQQPCSTSHDQEYENHFQQHEEMIEDSFYNVQVKEEIYTTL